MALVPEVPEVPGPWIPLAGVGNLFRSDQTNALETLTWRSSPHDGRTPFPICPSMGSAHDYNFKESFDGEKKMF